MKQDLIEELRKREIEVINFANELLENSKLLIEIENKVNLLKSKLVNQEGIIGLPNQAMREAKIEEIMQTDPFYSEHYFNLQMLKNENKRIYTLYNLGLELMKNTRTLLMQFANN